MAVPTLIDICQDVIIKTLEKNNFHPKLINDLCKRIPYYLLEGVFSALLERRVLTDVALVAFLVPDRTKLLMKGAVQIRNATFKQIAFNCPNLKSLNLSDCVQVSNSVVRAVLQGCPVLNELLLDRCHRVTDAAFDMNQSPFQPLIGCLSIEAISLQGCPQVTGSVAITLNKLCGKLKYLNLSQCKHIESPAIQQIFEHHELISVNLAFIDGVSDEAFFLFPPALPESSLGASHTLGPGTGPVSGRSPLQILNIGKSTITNLSLFRMAYLSELLEIHLQWCNGISDTGVEALTRHCPRLKLIDLKSCPITDVAVEAIARNSKQLTSLDISWCTGVTDAGICLLVQRIGSQVMEKEGIEEGIVSSAPTDGEVDAPDVSTAAFTSTSTFTADFLHQRRGRYVPSLDARVAPGCEQQDLATGLHHLCVVWCPQLTDESLQALALLPALRQLDAAGCARLTPPAVEALRMHGVNVTL